MKNTIKLLGIGGKVYSTEPQSGEGSPLAAAVFRQTLQGFGDVLPQAKRQAKKSAWTLVFLAVIGFSILACDMDRMMGTSNKDKEGGVSGTTFTDLRAFDDWLGKQPENTPDKPYRVKLNTNNLGYHFWGHGDRYVYLDCSGSTMTSINESAFSYCGSLVGIIIPDSVITIENAAFEQCHNLTDVTIGNGVTSIGDSAFSWCDSLTNLTMGNSVISIGWGAFWLCESLTSITIPDSVQSIGGVAFDRCTGLSSITIPNNVTTIGNYAFSECTGLTRVTIGNSVTYLSGFVDCTGLTGITIPNSVTTIGDSAFKGCTGLSSVTIPSSVTGINDGAFNGTTNLTRVTFEGTIPSSGFIHASVGVGSQSFPGDLRARFYDTDEDNGTPGTYKRESGSNNWELQP